VKYISVFTVLAAVAAGVVVGSPAARADDATPSPAPSVTDAQHADTESDAVTTAEQYDHPVTVDAETTPTSQVSALPDGTYRYTADSVPVRVQQNGAWTKVDTSLTQLSSGLWAPAASVAQVRFGDGGSNVLDQVQTPGGDWITETWPDGDLPAPTVSGSTATYADVLPGVDIRLTATPSGMSDVLVIDSAQAAANPDLQTLLLPVSGASVSATASDTTTATTSNGSAVVSASPVWWDSSAGSDVHGPAGDASARPVPHTASASGLSMSVASTIQAANPTYPVYVDPDWSTDANAFWFTDAAYPDQSYLNGNYADGIQSAGVGGGYRSDMFFQFPVDALEGTTVLDAEVDTTQVWANSCSPSPIDVEAYGPQAAGFTWNQEQSWSGQWGGILDSDNSTAGCSGQPASAVGWTVTDAVADYASAGLDTIQFGWTPDNPSSSVSRRHYSQSASLVVTYDTAPNAPTNLKFTSPPRACGTASAPAMVAGSRALTLQTKATDPDDGQLVNLVFSVAAVGSLGTTIWSTGTPDVAQGNVKVTIPSGTLSDGAYAWRAISGDRTLLSPYSTRCYFDVDSTAPAKPSLPAGPIGGLTVGTATTLTIAPGGPLGDAAEFEVWTLPGTASSTPPVPAGTLRSNALPACGSAQGTASFVCPDGTGSATVTVAPVDQTSTVWVAAIDGAGNVSATAKVELDAGDASETGAHGWHLQGYPSGALPTTLTDDDTSAATGLAGEKDLMFGPGVDTAVTGTVPTASGAADVIALSGLVAVTRQYNGDIHGEAVGETPMDGYDMEGESGELLPPSSGGSSVWGGSTKKIYLCTSDDGQTFLSPKSGCESSGADSTLIGYSFTTQPTGFGVTAAQLYRCSTDDDFLTTTSDSCEAWDEAPDMSLGWFITGDTIATASQAVDTTASFTASAWVKTTVGSSPSAHTILAESGPTTSGFALQENGDGSLQFCVNAQIAGGTSDCATASGTTSVGQWTLVTGVYDTVNHQVRLLVGDNISAAAIQTHVPSAGDVSANGAVTVGSSVANTVPVDQWNGTIADPVVIPAVIDFDQLDDLYYETPVA
jgi:hypothetical protein